MSAAVAGPSSAAAGYCALKCAAKKACPFKQQQQQQQQHQKQWQWKRWKWKKNGDEPPTGCQKRVRDVNVPTKMHLRQ